MHIYIDKIEIINYCCFVEISTLFSENSVKFDMALNATSLL